MSNQDEAPAVSKITHEKVQARQGPDNADDFVQTNGQAIAGINARDIIGNASVKTDMIEIGKAPKSEKQKKERKKLEKIAKAKDKEAARKATQANPESSAPKKQRQTVQFEYVEKTPKGQKKLLGDFDAPAHSSYNPPVVESAWYEWWEEQGFFKPRLEADGSVSEKGIFVIPVPPPNVTGALHIGHGLTTALQDTLIRWNRMLGKTVLYLPGYDHAGISTQSVVEKMLWVKNRQTRHDYSREDFVDLVWKWKEEYHERIKGQQKRIGASFDWSREAFTMDATLSKAVVETFVRLHEDGTIYRANRLVNWCTALSTTLSNLEVEQVEVSGGQLLSVPGYNEKVQFGTITSFAYRIEGSDDRIVVATTRPETMLGDTAVAVHPDDKRYQRFHGKFVVHPFVDRRLPIVADREAVDMEFGTGAVKITPAHDPNDYNTGVRHKLEFINILNDDGTLNGNAGKWNGVKRFDARKSVVAELKKLDLFVEIKDNPMTVPLCSKSKDVIEPVMKPQWWVKQRDMANAAMEAVRRGDIIINPKTSEDDFFRWLTDIQDWCISRQLWWGHRAPVYYVMIEGKAVDYTDNDRWIAGRSPEEAQEKAYFRFPDKTFSLEQDEDVLDTWFSSGLWPFSTLGWPQDTADMQRFYPTSLLETGWDILFFWVARMVMLGLKMTGTIPFREVYCHSLIRDAQGRKMSKSLGNVIDPLDVISGIPLDQLHEKLLGGNLDPLEVEKAKQGQKKSFPNGIPECGTDAMRFALCAYSTGGRDINLDILRVEGYRKFCNKIYNATKFALMKFDAEFIPQGEERRSGRESLVERWILHKYNKAAVNVNKALQERDFFTATNAAYQYWLYELCDVYIENSKHLLVEGNRDQIRSAQDTLYTCLDGALRMIHPFMPFVTEELWQRLPRRANDATPSIVVAAFPEYKSDFDDPSAESSFDTVFAVVKAARSLISEYNLVAGAQIYVECTGFGVQQIIAQQLASIKVLIKNCEKVQVIHESTQQPEGCAMSQVSRECRVLLLIKGQVNVDSEIVKAQKRIDKAEGSIANLDKQMAAKDYNTRVPEFVREQNDAKKATLQAEAGAVKDMIAAFEKLRA